MIKIEAWSLEEAYTLASKQLGCSITEIEYEITQFPSKGFLGIGKKKAILVATQKITPATKKPDCVQQAKANHSSSLKMEKKYVHREEKPIEEKVEETVQPIAKEAQAHSSSKPEKKDYYTASKIEDNFFKEELNISEICEEIELDINKLFALSCFDLDPITVTPYDDETVLISFSGPDSALLIGKEGYRYKALSYLIFNWINSKYGLLIRLEIAEFLRNQEDMISNYLQPLICQIRENRRGQTKVLDGVLIQIALKVLREEFTDLYVGVKTNEDGSKYIIVNEFYTKQNVK
ncbi:MAG: Jag N-terminal domain-containing protein [Campylobacteraceae bacterium]|jgi:spoIIIJ-associated protein|nr:Jag N-terminal domain-containing protein [Campylobacteraceae bacterium]